MHRQIVDSGSLRQWKRVDRFDLVCEGVFEILRDGHARKKPLTSAFTAVCFSGHSPLGLPSLSNDAEVRSLDVCATERC